MTVLSTALELVGLILMSAGLYLLAPWLGVTFAGLSLALLGLALDPPRRAATS